MSSEEIEKQLSAAVNPILKSLSDLYNYVDVSMISGGESLRVLWSMLRTCKGIQDVLKVSKFDTTDAYQQLEGWKGHLKQKMRLTYRIYFRQQGFSDEQIITLMEEREKEFEAF